MAIAHSGSEAVQIDLLPKALIVDDCRFIADRLTRALEAKGFECTVVADGYAGLELLRGQRFDLFVLDVDTPMVDGFSLLRHVRHDAVHAATPVLMLSAEHSQTDRDRATALGANGYMTKPLQLRPLNTMIETMKTPAEPAGHHAVDGLRASKAQYLVTHSGRAILRLAFSELFLPLGIA